MSRTSIFPSPMETEIKAQLDAEFAAGRLVDHTYTAQQCAEHAIRVLVPTFQAFRRFNGRRGRLDAQFVQRILDGLPAKELVPERANNFGLFVTAVAWIAASVYMHGSQARDVERLRQLELMVMTAEQGMRMMLETEGPSGAAQFFAQQTAGLVRELYAFACDLADIDPADSTSETAKWFLDATNIESWLWLAFRQQARQSWSPDVDELLAANPLTPQLVGVRNITLTYQ